MTNLVLPLTPEESPRLHQVSATFPRGTQTQVTKMRVSEPPMGRYEGQSADKMRGGYYTPVQVANWLCKWAIRNPGDSVLEPSCGEGRFLTATATRLLSLGARSKAIATAIQGIELVDSEAEAARAALAIFVPGARDAVACADFFDWWLHNSERRFSSVVGNPPFIRYQSFPEPSRGRAMAIMERLGLKANKLTNIWVPFVVAASEMLEPGGRMAMVIPAELLQVTYAAQLRSFLSERFTRLDVVTCNELFFENAEQEVVLLLADGARPIGSKTACVVATTQSSELTELLVSDPETLVAKAETKVLHGGEKWLKHFLTGAEISLMRELREHPRVVDFSHLAEVDVGIVTGCNDWFVLRGADLASRGLLKAGHRLVARSAHMRGAVLSDSDWLTLAAADERVHLVNIRRDAQGRISKQAAAYVTEGETNNVHLGYKCSIRKPWFHVPSLWVPDAFMFRQIHDFPRLVLNNAAATATDTIHRVRTRGINPAVLVAGAFSHLVAASAEIEGRSYGGGVLELEPTEAERLLVPDATAMAAALPLDECDALVRAGRLSAALDENDRLVLRGELGLSVTDCIALKGIWTKMQGRRFARGRSGRRKSRLTP